MDNLIPALSAGILAIIIALFTEGIFSKLVNRTLGKKPAEETYSQKLSRLTEGLAKSSREVDQLLSEFSQIAVEREKAVNRLEQELQALEIKEKQAKERVRALENIPLPVAEEFARLTSSGEKRSARRDYFLFGAGVIVTTILSILLSLTGFV